MSQLNITDAALIAKVKLLAERRQTSQTDALRQVVDEALARDKAGREAKRAAIMAIAERASKAFPPGTTSDHSDLYDETGLPR